MTSSVRSLARSTVHHSGLSTEHYQEALDRFALSLSLRATNTQRNYSTGAKSFLVFLEDRWGAPELEALNREHAETWLTYLVMDRGYGNSSVHGMAIATNVFCKRIAESDVLDGDLFSKVEIAQAAMPPIEFLKAEDVQAMVDAARREKTLWGRRDVAIMLLLYSAGFRQQELLNIAEQDIDWRRGTVSVLGKGSKPREVAPGAVAMSALDHYLAARAKYLRGLRSHRRAASPFRDDRPGRVAALHGHHAVRLDGGRAFIVCRVGRVCQRRRQLPGYRRHVQQLGAG